MDWNDVMLVDGQIFKSERYFFRDIAEETTARFWDTQITIVNIGVWKGASMHCFRLGSLGANLIGIDVMGAYNMEQRLVDYLRAEIIKRNSNYVSDPPNPIHLLFVDGGHEFETVEGDILLYCPNVVSGGYVLFHDAGESEVRGAISSALQETGDWTELTNKDKPIGSTRYFRREDG